MSNLKKYTYTRYYPVGNNIEQITGKSCFSFDYNSDQSVRVNRARSTGVSFVDGVISAQMSNQFHPEGAPFYRPANSQYSVLSCVSPSEWETMCQRAITAISEANDAAPNAYSKVIAPSTRQGVFCKSSNINKLISCFIKVTGNGGLVNRSIVMQFGIFNDTWNNGWSASLNPSSQLSSTLTPQSGGAGDWARIISNANDFLTKIKSYFTFYVSPQYGMIDYNTARTILAITSVNKNVATAFILLKQQIFSQGQYTAGDIGGYFNLSSDYSTFTLTEAGSVDPTDPGETPTPPVPPGPPDPPEPPDIPDPDDPITPPGLPDIGGANLGFFSVYNPTDVTMRLIAQSFWTTNILDQIKLYFDNPMETILGFGIVPIKPDIGAASHIMFGTVDSGVSAPVVTSEYKIVNCGSRPLHTYYGSYLDFEPYTEISMYLPYIGEVEMNPDEMMGREIGVLYYVNVISGDIVAMVTADGTIIYTAASNCFRQLPVSQYDMSQIIHSAIAAVESLGMGLVKAGVAAAAGGGGAIQSAAGYGASDAEITSATFKGGAGAAPSMLNSVMSMKRHYQRAGRIGTGSGQLSYQTPYMIVLRPNLMLPDGAGDVGTNSDLKAYEGYPCNQIVTMSSLHGMTVVEASRLAISGATANEIDEIMAMLKEGVIF